MQPHRLVYRRSLSEGQQVAANSISIEQFRELSLTARVEKDSKVETDAKSQIIIPPPHPLPSGDLPLSNNEIHVKQATIYMGPNQGVSIISLSKMF